MFFSTFLFLVLTAGNTWAESRDDLLFNQVARNNLAIQSFNKSKEAEETRQGYLGRSFLPTLVLELGQERFQTGRYPTRNEPYGSLEARFNLFKGGKDNLLNETRNLQAQIAGYNRDQTLRAEMNKIRKLQYQILFNNELISLIEKELEENKKINAQAAQRVRSGVSTKTDSLEFNIYESELVETIESLQHETRILKIGLMPLIGVASSEDVRVQGTLDHQHDDELLARNYSFKTHPEVASLDAEFESLSRQKRVNSLWWTPQLDLYGGYYLYTLRDRDYLAYSAREDRVVGLRLTMELFDGLKGSKESTANSYQAEAKRIMARHSERQTEAKFLMLKEDLTHTHEVMHYVLDRIKKSKEYLKLTLNEYDRGVKNSLDALTAMQRYYRYKKQYLEKKKEYQIIKADLLAILGE